MKLFFWLILIVLIFLLGWLFPVEGPFDYVYDTHVHKIPCKTAPAPKKEIIYEDYNEDGEPEWYQLIPMFEVIND